MSGFTTTSNPQHPALLDSAGAQKAATEKEAAVNTYKRDWLDAPRWEELAKARGIRLPHWSTAPTPESLAKWWRKLSSQPMAEVYGVQQNGKPLTWTQLIERNPTMPLRAFIGQMLEQATPAPRAASGCESLEQAEPVRPAAESSASMLEIPPAFQNRRKRHFYPGFTGVISTQTERVLPT